MKILIVDDEVKLCDALEEFLNEAGDFMIDKAYDGESALTLLKTNRYEVLLCDINLPGINGLEIAQKIPSLNRETKIILFSGRNELIESINSLGKIIYDFLPKPIDTKILYSLLIKIRNELKNKQNELNLNEKNFLKIKNIKIQELEKLHDALNFYNESHCIVSCSPLMKTIFQKLRKLSDYPDIPLLIEGETGTGKELIAEYIHFIQKDNTKPFVALNCATIPLHLFEAELFGYEKGSFTGADPKGKEGKIKAAGKGTLFLDEITEISPEHQPKLLRILQEKEYYKVGSNIKHKVECRIVCATNKNIPALIEKNLFREDLYYRLNVCKINIPSLKERKEDIIPLLLYFIAQNNGQNPFQIHEVKTEALKTLMDFHWPGNVRELKNAVLKAMLFNEKKYLDAEDFSFLKVEQKKCESILNPHSFILPEQPFNLEGFNQKIIQETLRKFNGNKTKTAEFLGLNRIQMYYRFKIKDI